jgi:membrane protease YdiL (CAAX protease family)
VFGLIYLWTGSLLIPMIVHALVDLRALLLLMGVNGHDDQSHNAVADTI